MHSFSLIFCYVFVHAPFLLDILLCVCTCTLSPWYFAMCLYMHSFSMLFCYVFVHALFLHAILLCVCTCTLSPWLDSKSVSCVIVLCIFDMTSERRMASFDYINVGLSCSYWSRGVSRRWRPDMDTLVAHCMRKSQRANHEEFCFLCIGPLKQFNKQSRKWRSDTPRRSFGGTVMIQYLIVLINLKISSEPH